MKHSTFEKKIGQGLFLALGVLGATSFTSALFLEFRGTLDFVFRVATGLFSMLFAAWGGIRR